MNPSSRICAVRWTWRRQRGSCACAGSSGARNRSGLENVGAETVFSDFEVTNPGNGNRYRVAIRGVQPGENFCACPDFATNDLGTCKHVEFVLGKLEKKRGGRKALAQGFRSGLQRDLSELRESNVRYGFALVPNARRS